MIDLKALMDEDARGREELWQHLYTHPQLNLKFKRLTNTMTIPTKAHPTDTCFDIYADIPNPIKMSRCENGEMVEYDEGISIYPHETVKISTGFATNIPHGYWAAIFARSGLASKNGLRPAQGVPVIDEPYTGEWIIPLHNDTDKAQVIHHGDRIAQFMLLPWYETNLIEVDELDTTDRADGGFGSTGK